MTPINLNKRRCQKQRLLFKFIIFPVISIGILLFKKYNYYYTTSSGTEQKMTDFISPHAAYKVTANWTVKVMMFNFIYIFKIIRGANAEH